MFLNVRRFLSSHPVMTALGASVLCFCVFALPVLTSSKAFGQDSTRTAQSVELGQLPLEFVLAVSAVAVLIFVGWGRTGRLLSRPAWGGMWYVLPPFLFTLGLLGLGLLNGSQSEGSMPTLLSGTQLWALLALVILVGVFEETLFRGIVLHGFERRIGPVGALFISSLIFGSMHYVNWIGGQDLTETHQQVLHAGLSGILYGALALRLNSIWPGIFLHAFWDFTVTANGALLSGTAAGGTAAGGDGGGVASFLFGNFEPIMGLIVLFGWYRWHKTRSD